MDGEASVDGSSDEDEESDGEADDFIVVNETFEDENTDPFFYHQVDNVGFAETTEAEYSESEDSEDEVDEEKFNLLCRKGVFFYDYLDCSERFSKTSLPDKVFQQTISK